MNVRPESDETLVKRLLPNVNRDARDRASAWREWYTRIGEIAVLGFIRAKNDTAEQDADILQEAMLTAFLEIERGRYQPRVGIPFTAYVKGIARNKIREARRRNQRLVPLDDTPEHVLESPHPQLETVIERREARDALTSPPSIAAAGIWHVVSNLPRKGWSWSAGRQSAPGCPM